MAPFQFEYVKIEYFDSVGFEHMALPRLSRYINKTPSNKQQWIYITFFLKYF
jgi:hypothetical protein